MAKGKPSETCGDHGGTSKQTGEPCGRPAGWGVEDSSGKCKHHRGTSPDGESHEGNGFASKHNLHANRGLFYDRLDESKQQDVDELEYALIERYKEYHGREPDKADVKDLFEIAVGYVQRDYAREWMVEQMEESGNPLLEHVEYEENGEQREFNKANELLDQINNNRREDRLQRRDKGLEHDPESQKAEATSDLAEVWEADLTD